MHIPKIYQNNNENDIFDFLQKNSFGLIINNGKTFPIATQTIFEFLKNKDDNFFLRGHISKANIQSKEFLNNTNVLCVFQGSHTYISSSWYSIPEVPTWNYITVQIEGKIKIIESEKIILEHLNNIVNKYEKTTKTNLQLNNLPHKVVYGQMKGIIAFEIEILNIYSANKLSQNRNEVDYLNIINQLNLINNNSSKEIALEMDKKCPFKPIISKK